jgi:hypothetical protein
MVKKMMKKEREEDEFMGFVLLLKFFFLYIEKMFLTIKSKLKILKKCEKESTNPIHHAKSTILHTHIISYSSCHITRFAQSSVIGGKCRESFGCKVGI